MYNIILVIDFLCVRVCVLTFENIFPVYQLYDDVQKHKFEFYYITIKKPEYYLFFYHKCSIANSRTIAFGR